MIFILSKLLLFLIKPLIWACCLFLFALFSKNALRRKRFVIAGVVVLLFFSNGFIFGKVANAYEAGYPRNDTYDIGIILGGFSGLNTRNNQISFAWSSDRLFQTLALYKTDKIKKILIASGNGSLGGVGVKEADLAHDYLKEIGVPDSAMLIENQSRNTIENAANCYKLLKRETPDAKILVITSAWHIPRAKLIFSKYFGEKLNYYPTNFIGKTEFGWTDFIIPSAEALGNWELLLKEWIGLVADQIRA